MNNTLIISAEGKTDVLSKVFGIIRRLNFVVENVLVIRSEKSAFKIILTVRESNNRLSFEYLTRQIEKLIDVTSVLNELGNDDLIAEIGLFLKNHQ